jgi:hypothetical protein
VGVDCVGLTIEIARDLSLVSVADLDTLPTDYMPRPDPKLFRSLLNTHMMPVWPPLPGDWIWIASPMQLPTHMAMIVSERSIIHAYESVGSVVEHPFGLAALRLSKGAYSYRGIVHER